MSFPASERQLSFIERLCAERHPNGQAAAVVLRQQRLTKEGAGKVIDALMAMPVIEREAPAAAAGAPVDNRGSLPHNRFSGKCVLCGHEVAAQAGTYRKGTTVRWETLHLPGECPSEAAPAPAAKRTWNDIIGETPDGFYAVPSITGTNDLSFFKVYTNQGRVDPSKKGKRGIKQVIGGGTDGRVGTEWVEKAIAAVEALGADDCRALYGQHIGECGFCSKPLTRKYSRGMGYGPSCAKRWGLPFDFAAYSASEVIAEGGE
jgi:hypothetical protein